MQALSGLMFFASGFAALVYQILWQRLLVIFSGSDVHSATVIVAAFMAGLGCGNLAGAQAADRLSARANLACFAIAELAIGAFGFFSADLYYGVLYRRFGHIALSSEARGALLFVSLLWPTFFMGVSLPLLARALTTRIQHAAGVTGRLYACNTAGAAAGAFVVTWVLLPALGLERSLQLSAAVNVLAAIGVAPILSSMRARPLGASDAAPSASTSAGDDATSAPAATIPVPFAVWASIYAVSGFLALSLEIVWFRLLGVMLKSTALTFGTLLSIYLSGIGLGAAIGTRLLPRTRLPAHAFLVLQAVIAIYAGLAVAALLATVGDWRGLAWLSSYFASYEPMDARAAVRQLGLVVRGGGGELPAQFLMLYVALPAVLILPPTLLMGASFPLLMKAVQTDLARLGRQIGGLLTANIAGSALGSIVTGWVSLGWLGSSGTLKMLVAVGALFPLCGLVLSRGEPHRGSAAVYGTALAASALLFLAMPSGASLWATFHGAAPAFVDVGEDGSGTSVLRTVPGREPSVVVFANGVGQSWIPYGGIHTVLGALPAFIHPRPRTAAVIGLGSGDTLFGVAGRQELERITCVEIIRPQLDTLNRLLDRWRYPGLAAILSDPRIDHVQGDGRLHVMHSPQPYDIIEADALRPTSAYSGLLYSDTYFALIRDRLTPGGLAVSWSPTARVHDTFVSVFPHVLSYGDIVIGSNRAIGFDADAVRRRLADPRVRAYYGRAVVDIASLLDAYLDRAPRVYGPSDDRSRLDDINTDLFPKDEFSVPFKSGR